MPILPKFCFAYLVLSIFLKFFVVLEIAKLDVLLAEEELSCFITKAMYSLLIKPCVITISKITQLAERYSMFSIVYAVCFQPVFKFCLQIFFVHRLRKSPNIPRVRMTQSYAENFIFLQYQYVTQLFYRQASVV